MSSGRLRPCSPASAGLGRRKQTPASSTAVGATGRRSGDRSRVSHVHGKPLPSPPPSPALGSNTPHHGASLLNYKSCGSTPWSSHCCPDAKEDMGDKSEDEYLDIVNKTFASEDDGFQFYNGYALEK